ncbi:hypothetical protein DdX_02940 [Ditylenchus destructor]|uniref:Uncharacterized protein n=1 Tax=Ditylenchus destructor TaxID=166010 RepID=A0AAD4NC48_9BILA|nr:hypothetical protein DdX_02940 [Ditylenchus destructor]
MHTLDATKKRGKENRKLRECTPFPSFQRTLGRRSIVYAVVSNGTHGQTHKVQKRAQRFSVARAAISYADERNGGKSIGYVNTERRAKGVTKIDLVSLNIIEHK